MKKAIFLAILLLITFPISGCIKKPLDVTGQNQQNENINQQVEKLSCNKDSDCLSFCSLCANKNWLEKNYDLNKEYCPTLPDFDSCLCVDNECTKFIQGKKMESPSMGKEFLYMARADIIPNEYLINWAGPNYENDIIKRLVNQFTCKKTGESAEIVKYFEGGLNGGEGKFYERYAIVCDNQYFIEDYTSAQGSRLYGPFQIILE